MSELLLIFFLLMFFAYFFFNKNFVFVLTCFFISLLYISTVTFAFAVFRFVFFLIFVIRLCLYRCESTRLFWCYEYMSAWRLRALQIVSFRILRRCLERQRMWYWCWPRWLLKQRTFYKIDFFSLGIMSNNNFYSDDFFF